MKIKKSKGIILKLDFEKSFDTVNWDIYIRHSKTYELGEKWIM